MFVYELSGCGFESICRHLIINKILEPCTNLFLINCLVNCKIFNSKNFMSLKAYSSEFSWIEVLFTDQNSKLLNIKGKKGINLVIN